MIHVRWAASNALPANIFETFRLISQPRRDAHDALPEDRSIGCLVSDPESRRPKHHTSGRDAHDALQEDRSIGCLVSDPESRRPKHDTPRRDAHDALPEDRSIFDRDGMRITHCQRLMLNNLSKNMPLGPLVLQWRITMGAWSERCARISSTARGKA